MNDLFKIFNKLRLWQISIVISILLLTLTFTGGVPFTDINLREGESNQAISGGVVFFLLGVILKLIDMLLEKHNGEK